MPPPLGTETDAYRLGGYGRNEIVVYYHLVRTLVWNSRDQVRDAANSAPDNAGRACLTTRDFIATEVPRLEKFREEYLDTPESEYHGRTPRDVIERERRRLPEGVSGKELMIDHDCPLCQMMADMPGPAFWGLDGSSMDDEFAFSFHRTREEYDAEQQKWAEFNRKFNETRAEEKRLGVNNPEDGYSPPEDVWERSFVAREGADFPAMRLFAIGSRLAELIYDLKHPTEDRALIDQFSRDYGNLREAAGSEEFGAALIEPVLSRFCETLTDVAAARSDLVEKCDSLQSDLQRFCEPPREPDPDDDTDQIPYDDDVPF